MALRRTRDGQGFRTRWSLTTRVILLQVGIVLVGIAVAGFGLMQIFVHARDAEYGRFSLGVARTVATMPEVRQAFHQPNPAAVLQPLAERVRSAAGVSFVVILNRDQVRYSHPDPTKVGKKVTADASGSESDASVALSGTDIVATEQGSLGTSVRGKVPVYDDDGTIIGAVSVGVLVERIRQIATASWGTIATSLSVGLLLGIAGSVLLAMRIKREILGLEPAEIAEVFQQREAMLQSMREGVIAVDETTCITSLNEEARRLLAVDDGYLGCPVGQVLPDSRLPDAVRTGQPQFDEMLVQGGRILIANSVPMLVGGHIVGAVVTFRDHTEVDGLARELASVRQYADALRAQSHEFTNKLHTIAGMLELGWHEQAATYITQTNVAHQQRHEAITQHILDPHVSAVLIGKASVAAERGITLTLHPSSRLPAGTGLSEELITVVGNLVQNAIDAVADLAPEQRRVGVSIRSRGGQLRVRVADRGPGVPPAQQHLIFTPGFTTKGQEQRGIGLALVKGLVQRLGGSITVHNHLGAVFTVTLPCSAPKAHT